MSNDLDMLRGDNVPRAKDGQVALLRQRIADIVKLSHSREPADEQRYRERQVELRDLTARLIEAERGDHGDQPVDLANAVVEKIGGMWRIVCGTTRLAWSFGDRATAEKFLDQLKRDEQQKDSSTR